MNTIKKLIKITAAVMAVLMCRAVFAACGGNTDTAPSGDNLSAAEPADTDYRYITNVNCAKGTGKIAKDHRNFDEYRLYTLVVNYEGDSASKKAEKLDARSYIRYYDANGKLRVFYNDYKKNMYYGGCMCSFNQVSSMAIPTNAE